MSEERRIILQMLRDGKLTVDEVDALLEALDHNQHTDDADSTSADSAAAKAKDYLEKSRDKVEEGILKIRQVVREKGPTAEDVDQVVKQVQRGMNRLLDELPNVMSRLRRFDFQPGPQHRFHHSFSGYIVPGTRPAVRVHAGNGNIVVNGGDGPDYRVNIETIVYMEDEAQARDVNTEAVTWESTAGGFSLDVDESVHCIIRITLPRRVRYDADITAGDGGLTWRHADADQLRLLTGDGPITLDNCSATGALVQTNDGPIKMTAVHTGPLTAVTGDGSIYYDGFASNLQCKTGDGPIRVRFRMPGPTDSPVCHIGLKTGDGPLRLTFASVADMGIRLNLQTKDGPIDVDVRDLLVTDNDRTAAVFAGETDGYEHKAVRLDVQAETKDGPIAVSAEGTGG